MYFQRYKDRVLPSSIDMMTDEYTKLLTFANIVATLR